MDELKQLFCSVRPEDTAAGSAPGSAPGSALQNGPLPSNALDPAHSSCHCYVSSDNEDSGPEDEAFQREVSRLREKYVWNTHTHTV